MLIAPLRGVLLCSVLVFVGSMVGCRAPVELEEGFASDGHEVLLRSTKGLISEIELCENPVRVLQPDPGYDACSWFVYNFPAGEYAPRFLVSHALAGRSARLAVHSLPEGSVTLDDAAFLVPPSFTRELRLEGESADGACYTCDNVYLRGGPMVVSVEVDHGSAVFVRALLRSNP